MPKSSRRRTNRKGGNAKFFGGSCGQNTGAYATQVYGAAPVAASPATGNLIQMNQVGQTGGDCSIRRGGGLMTPLVPAEFSTTPSTPQKGGNVLEVTVPATLVIANHMLGKRKSRKNTRRRRYSRSRR